jgi:hypothetical protein
MPVQRENPRPAGENAGLRDDGLVQKIKLSYYQRLELRVIAERLL